VGDSDGVAVVGAESVEGHAEWGPGFRKVGKDGDMCPRCGGFIIRERMSDSPSWSLGYVIEVGKCIQCCRRFEGGREWGKVEAQDVRVQPSKYGDRKDVARRRKYSPWKEGQV